MSPHPTSLRTLAGVVGVASCLLAKPLHAEPAKNVCESPRDANVSLFPRPRANLVLHVAQQRSRTAGQLAPSRPSVGSTPAPAASRQLSLEIKDSSPGHAPLVERFSVPVTTGEASKLESRVGDASYEIAIFDDGVRPLVFDVQREQREADSRWSKAKLRTSVRMKPGQRATIARIDHADGRRTELTATLR